MWQVSPALPGEPQKKTQFTAEDDEDGDDHPQTIILANSQDKFVLDQVRQASGHLRRNGSIGNLEQHNHSEFYQELQFWRLKN